MRRNGGPSFRAGTVASILALATAQLVAAQTIWTTLSPKGEGFSIEIPGTPSPNSKPGYYIYNADEWAYFVRLSPISDTVREFVSAGERGPLKQYLDTIHKGFLKTATERTSSDADFAGYPSLRFSAEGQTDDKQAFEGRYWLVVTEEHLYTLMALGPKGSSSANADRFLASFKLDKSAPPRTPASTAAKSPLAAKLTAPILAVTTFAIEQQLNPRIDEFVQNAPPAQPLGSRWSPALPAWQQARTAVTKRIAAISQLYDVTGQLDRVFDEAAARLAPGAQADAIVHALDGPAGVAILRDNAVMEFASAVMGTDPNGPKPGERPWMDKLNAVVKTFDDRFGSTMPRDKSREAEVSAFVATPTGEALKKLWSSVVGKATVEITGAINLMMFDDREAIMREIAAAVATVK
jgi:hypothetical protein